ncbi:MAG: hypothetical protein JRJ47_00925 [Deltaproteobacteria bacterium]|nr:hypothetical protein [Deltaproteobacteria bacterium]
MCKIILKCLLLSVLTLLPAASANGNGPRFSGDLAKRNQLLRNELEKRLEELVKNVKSADSNDSRLDLIDSFQQFLDKFYEDNDADFTSDLGLDTLNLRWCLDEIIDEIFERGGFGSEECHGYRFRLLYIQRADSPKYLKPYPKTVYSLIECLCNTGNEGADRHYPGAGTK